jgi:hypothetical protein
MAILVPQTQKRVDQSDPLNKNHRSIDVLNLFHIYGKHMCYIHMR